MMVLTSSLWQHLGRVGCMSVFPSLFHSREKWKSSMLGTGSDLASIPYVHGFSSLPPCRIHLNFHLWVLLFPEIDDQLKPCVTHFSWSPGSCVCVCVCVPLCALMYTMFFYSSISSQARQGAGGVGMHQMAFWVSVLIAMCSIPIKDLLSYPTVI